MALLESKNGKLWVGNLGDSRVIMFCYNADVAVTSVSTVKEIVCKI